VQVEVITLRVGQEFRGSFEESHERDSFRPESYADDLAALDQRQEICIRGALGQACEVKRPSFTATWLAGKLTCVGMWSAVSQITVLVEVVVFRRRGCRNTETELALEGRHP